MGPLSLSVVVTTFNNRATIGRCLASVAWASERIVIDGGSTDGTIGLARAAGATVECVDNPAMLNLNKNLGFDRCRSDWILSLDSDEELSPALATSIRRAMSDSQSAAFWCARQHRILNAPLRFGPWGQDQQLRLFRRGRGRFACRDIHEYLDVEGHAGKLDGLLWHHRPAEFRAYRRRILHYSRHRARRYLQERRPLRPWRMILGPARVLLDALIWRRGLLDGPVGIYLAAALSLEALCDHLYHLRLLWLQCASSS